MFINTHIAKLREKIVITSAKLKAAEAAAHKEAEKLNPKNTNKKKNKKGAI